MRFPPFLACLAMVVSCGLGCSPQADAPNQSVQREPPANANAGNEYAEKRQPQESGKPAGENPAASTPSAETPTVLQPEELPPLELDGRELFGYDGEQFTLRDAHLTQQGGIHPDVIKAAEARRGIFEVTVAGSKISDRGLAQLAALPWVGEVEVVRLSNTRITDGGLDELAGMPALSELYLPDCNQITDNGLDVLASLENLTQLVMGGTQIGNAGLAHVAKLEGLEGLDVGFSKVTDAGLIHLGGLKRLRWLDVQCCAISDAGLESLAGLSALESLDVSDHVFEHERVTNITGAGLRHIAKLTNLETLDLDYTAVNNQGVEHLRPLGRLESLSLDGTKVSDAAGKHLAQLASLQTLSVKRTQFGDDGMEPLAGSTDLEELTIEETPVTDAGLAHLESLKHLRTLWLEDSKVTYEGVQRLRAALPELEVEGTPRRMLTEHVVDVAPLAELEFADEFHQIYTVAFSPNGDLLAAAGEVTLDEGKKGRVKLWDARTNKPLDTIALGEAVHGLSFSGDGKLLVISGQGPEQGHIWFWDLSAKKAVATLEHGRSVRRAELLPDGDTCFSAALLGDPPISDSSVKVWNWKDGKEVASFDDAEHVAAVSHDGKLLATTMTLALGIELVNLETKEQVSKFEYASDADIQAANPSIITMAPLMFSPDGKLLAYGMSDWGNDAGYAPVKIWNVRSGEKSATLKQYGVLRSVVFSPDGQRIATGGFLIEDFSAPRGRIKLFDVATGEEQCTMTLRISIVTALSFSPNGKVLAATTAVKIRLWEVEKLLEAAGR